MQIAISGQSWQALPFCLSGQHGGSGRHVAHVRHLHHLGRHGMLRRDRWRCQRHSRQEDGEQEPEQLANIHAMTLSQEHGAGKVTLFTNISVGRLELTTLALSMRTDNR
jgi:hypothetical protein